MVLVPCFARWYVFSIMWNSLTVDLEVMGVTWDDRWWVSVKWWYVAISNNTADTSRARKPRRPRQDRKKAGLSIIARPKRRQSRTPTRQEEMRIWNDQIDRNVEARIWSRGRCSFTTELSALNTCSNSLHSRAHCWPTSKLECKWSLCCHEIWQQVHTRERIRYLDHIYTLLGQPEATLNAMQACIAKNDLA